MVYCAKTAALLPLVQRSFLRFPVIAPSTPGTAWAKINPKRQQKPPLEPSPSEILIAENGLANVWELPAKPLIK